MPVEPIDCIVCGTCTVDVLTRPVPLGEPPGAGRLFHVGPIEATTGGLVCNAGVAMRRLGLEVAALGLLGDDAWAEVVRSGFAHSRWALLGYFGLLPGLERSLPRALQAIRAAGCHTALDTAGDGGTLDDLAPALPLLDLFVPSLGEASRQTGLTDPRSIVAALRSLPETLALLPR